MKKCFSFLILCLFTGLLSPSFAAYETLKEPWVALPVEFPKDARDKVQAALRRDDCKFLSGASLNAFTSLNYAGDTKALNLFIEQLAQCPGIGVAVAFASESIPAECDWQVSCGARVASQFNFQPNYIQMVVRINLKSTKVKLENLVIPDLLGPPLEKKP